MRDTKPDYLTGDQQKSLETELAELEGPRRTAAVEAIKTARGFGDLSENFEYHAARDEQAMLERRITLLRAQLDNAVVIAAEDRAATDTVSVGSVVQIEDDEGETSRDRDLERRWRRLGISRFAAWKRFAWSPQGPKR